MFFKFLVTTIDVIVKGKVEDEDEYGKGAEYVEFAGEIEARPDDDDTAFLLNVTTREVPNTEGDSKEPKYIHDAIKVTKETFLEKLIAENTKFLGCIHGFQVEPHYWMEEVTKIQSNDAFPYTCIPIIWPSQGKAKGIIDLNAKYDNEQVIAAQAGRALASIAEGGNNISLSLLAHSMGNRATLAFAQTAPVAKRFDSIFMIAADVWEEVFNERVITDTWCQPPWNYTNYFKDSGLRLCNMVRDGGKIHVVHYPRDLALLSSHYWENRRNRLGRYGIAPQVKLGRLHRDLIDKIVDVDLSEDTDGIKGEDRGYSHSYYALQKLVDYYTSVMSE